MNADKIAQEANQIIKEEFDKVESQWRSRATVSSVPNFHVVDKPDPASFNVLPYRGELPRLKTYAKMLSLSAEFIESGEYRNEVRKWARRAADQFVRMFDEATKGELDADVAFLNGVQHPTVEAVTVEASGEILLRGYFDFGISPAATQLAARK